MRSGKFARLRYYANRPFAVCKCIFGEYSPSIKQMDYNKYWGAKGKFGFSTRYPVFADVIEKDSSVLDIGCGDGSTLIYLIEKKKIRGEGVDISERAVNMARAGGIQAHVADVSSDKFKIRKKYDYIIVSEVLEHIPNPEDVMKKAKGRFNKLLIISMPNTGHYLYRLRLLFGRFPVQWAYHPGEHLRFWTVKDFRQWAGELGFRIVGMRTHSGVPFLRVALPALFADSIVYLLEEKRIH